MQTKNKVHRIPYQRAIQFLTSETDGRIFSAYFRKNDGTMRNIVARRGVRKHLKGGKLPYDPKRHNLLSVFDVQAGEYRMIRFATLVSFNVGGETFILV